MSDEILYHSQMISFLEELWGDGFLSPGGADEVKKVLEGIKIKDQPIMMLPALFYALINFLILINSTF